MTIRDQHGFTLIELSIVLVIIALIAGSVLAGRDLIYTAQLRATASDIEKIRTAVYTFYGKYGGLPGDLPNAYQFWGSACGPNGTGGTNGVLPSDDQACNGNGNGYIEYYSAPWGEDKKAWQHLTLAGLIPGSYSGYENTSLPVPGVVMPPGRISGTEYEFVAFGSPAGFPSDIYGNTGNFIEWSSYNPGIAAAGSNLGFMTAQAAYAFDQKFDDGNPSTGHILAAMGAANGLAQWGCVSNWYVATAPPFTFVMSDPNAYCLFYFRLGL